MIDHFTKDFYGLQLVNPHVLLLVLIDEIQGNELRNEEIRKDLLESLGKALKLDPIINASIPTEFSLVLGAFNQPLFYLLQTCKTVLSFFSSTEYARGTFAKLRESLITSESLDSLIAMKPSRSGAVPLVILLSLCLCGCDYTRKGGAYRLAFQDQAAKNSVVTVGTKDEDALRGLLGQWLSRKGFSEFKFTAKRSVWRKGGARVYVSQEVENEVVVEISAMGYTSDLRLSEETERELFAYLEKQPGLKITPTTTPPRPTGN